MSNLKVVAAKVAVSLVAVGSLAGVGAGVAGVGPAGAATQVHTANHAAQHQRWCTNEKRLTTAASRRQAKFAATTAKFVHLEAKANAAGNTSLAKYWAKVVAHRDLRDNRMKASFDARMRRDAHRRSASGRC